MMATELLAGLRARGIVVRAEEDRIKWAAPPGQMTDDLRSAIRLHKRDLLALLSLRRCAICWQQRPADRLEEQLGVGRWWRCREGCSPPLPRRAPEPADPDAPTDPASIV